MGKIVITANVTLDGVVEDPDGQEGFSRGGWFSRAGGPDLGDWATAEQAEAMSTAALLLGRRSEQWFATRWASRAGEFADRLNELPKYVLAAAGHEPVWSNVTVLTGSPAGEVTKLKQQVDGDIVVYGSYQLARTLVGHDLADELRLFIFPVVAGAGRHLFGDTAASKPFRLTGSATIGSGLAFLRYEAVPDAGQPEADQSGPALR